MNKEPVIAKAGFCERRTRGASVSVRIPAESYALLRKIQDDLSEGFGSDLSISQTIAAVIFRYTHDCA